MAHEKELADHARRKAKAEAMGSPKRLAERARAGILNARQRIDHLLDQGSFAETGLFAVSERPEMADRSPGDGAVDGYGRIDGREVAIAAQDFTTLGASSAIVAGQKLKHLMRATERDGMPLVYLSECSGARIPDIMGARGMGRVGNGLRYNRVRRVPWADVILGVSYGLGTWMAALSDFVVMRKGGVMAVSSPRVTSLAISEDIDPEELGGWRLQTEVTGQVDLAVESDQAALDAIRGFLGLLPSHCDAAPPVAAVPAGSGEHLDDILDLVPAERARTYDVRKVVRLLVDRDSLFPLKDRFGRSLTTALARLGGRSIGILANNPMFKGGALDADACDKATSFLALCDSYNLPVILLADTPGFLIGVEGERRKVPGKIMNFLQALELCTVPVLSVILRKSYGQAYLNMGGGRSDEMAVWVTGDISFVDPEIGASIVTGVTPAADPETFAAAVRDFTLDCTPYDLAGPYLAQTVIDPRETRDWLIRMLQAHGRRPGDGVGQHRLQSWPFTY